MFCFNPSLHPPVLYKKPHISLEDLESLLLLLGLTLLLRRGDVTKMCGKLILRLLPNTGRPICISIGMVRGYWFLLLGWKLLRLSEDPLYTTSRGPAGPVSYRGELLPATHPQPSSMCAPPPKWSFRTRRPRVLPLFKIVHSS